MGNYESVDGGIRRPAVHVVLAGDKPAALHLSLSTFGCRCSGDGGWCCPSAPGMTGSVCVTGIRLLVDGRVGKWWDAGRLRFDTRSRIIFKSVATGVFCTESGSDWTRNQRMEGSCESGRTLRTENQNLG